MHAKGSIGWVRWLGAMLVAWCALLSVSAEAATCSSAGAQGAAPSSWQSYCWLDLSSYNDTTARSTAGQTFSFNLADGSTLTFQVKATSTASTALLSKTAPSWSGAAVGNTSFLSIPGKPILYTTTDGSTVTLTISSITVLPPPGVATVNDYAFVVADAESTDNAEYLQYTTNGSAWTILDTVAPISGSNYPLVTGAGTTTLRESGNSTPSPIGAYIVGSNKPTTVGVTLKAGGLQGVMFAVRFASIKLTKQIVGARVDPADQFTFSIRSTSSTQVLATGTTTGTGNGPFNAAVISTASGIPITLTESMATGSIGTLSQYRASLSCTNATAGSPTVLPNNLVTTSYDFGSLSFGDIISCIYTNAPYPHLKLMKALAASGRIFASDQFTVRIKQGATIVASTTTTGSGSTVSNGSTGFVQLTQATAYQMDELAVGSTNLARYTKGLACTNAYTGSGTALPSSLNSNVSPDIGDVITCTITNTRDPANAVIRITKSSTLQSDGVNLSNPKAIPGAIVRYAITVTNEGDAPVDINTIIIADALPANLTYSVTPSVSFTNGTTPSGLVAFNPATAVRFSSQSSGGAPYTYTPSGTFDPNVRGIRVNPSGIMAASNGTNHPSFTVSFEARVN